MKKKKALAGIFHAYPANSQGGRSLIALFVSHSRIGGRCRAHGDYQHAEMYVLGTQSDRHGIFIVSRDG